MKKLKLSLWQLMMESHQILQLYSAALSPWVALNGPKLTMMEEDTKSSRVMN